LMLYDKIGLPLFSGSFHTRCIDVAVADALTDMTGPGELGGVMHVAMALKGPAPALFNACNKENNACISRNHYMISADHGILISSTVKVWHYNIITTGIP